jgi:ATP-dependent helicase HrpA
LRNQFTAIARQLPGALLIDRGHGRRELERLRVAAARNESAPRLLERTARLARRIRESAGIRAQRLASRREWTVAPDLPIYAQKEALIETIRDHRVVIVAGETGSGKSTQLPKLCLAAGRGVDGRIGVTQPRRIAAMTVCRRLAEELGETVGETVGYQIRFQDVVGPTTRVKVMTDGILLAETHADPLLLQYDTLIVDEAHERSLNVDFILGLAKSLLHRRRDLKLIITSATLDTEKFSRAFDHAPVIQVSGRLYDVETRYLPPTEEQSEESTHVEQAVRAVEELHQTRARGDILIFMPTEQDIRDTCELLRGRRFADTRIIPLFGRLTAAEQQKVFQTLPGRKIVVATNVAETSITIPGIRFVIDTGLARISQYTPRSRTTTLPVAAISQSSADQRKGRCGRVADGVCIRLYSEQSYLDRPKYTPPEIVRANLAEVILRMIALRLGDVAQFAFIDPPHPRSVQDGCNLLLELGAITPADTQRPDGGRFTLTPKGKLMARLPLDPRLACMLLEARQRDCLGETAVIAAALSIQDPRERPMEKQAQADQAHARFSDPVSDFITLLRIWRAYRAIVDGRSGWGAVRAFCQTHFLSFRRMREWQDVYDQILDVLADNAIRPSRPLPETLATGDPADSGYAALHLSILSGFLSNIACKKEKQIFQAAYGRQAMIFPGSGLFKNPGQWIVAAEMVETSRLFARCAAVILPAWIEAVAGDQCKSVYLDPHWERQRGQVIATQQVTLYGLVLDRRPRPYGPVNPREAGDIFIQRALIDGDLRQPPAFLAHNRQLIEEVEEIQHRLRRRDLLVDEAWLREFYAERLPDVYDIRTLTHRIRKAGGDSFLRLTRDDLIARGPEAEELAAYPEQIKSGPHRLAVDYRFEPGREEDGVTVRVPREAAGGLAVQSFQWLVPGLLKEKIAALVKALPKELRKQLLPLNATAETIAREMPIQSQISLTEALSRFIRQRYHLVVPESAWNEAQLPDHLRMRIAVTDPNGRVLRSGRDHAILRAAADDLSSTDELARVIQAWERSGIDDWNFGDLPDVITLSGAGGRQWSVYPCLEVRREEIVRTAKVDPEAARRAHALGVRALLIRRLGPEIKFLKRNLQLSAAYDPPGRYFGGRAALEEKLLQRVLDDSLAKPVRTAGAFERLADRLEREGLAACGQQTRHRVMEVLEAYQTTRARLFELETTHRANAAALAFLAELRGLLETLVPPNFVQLYDDDRLGHLPRYLRALTLRAQRGVLNPEKDRI